MDHWFPSVTVALTLSLLRPGCSSPPVAQPGPKPAPPAGTSGAAPRVISNLSDPPGLRQRLREWGVEAGMLMPGHAIDPDNSATWDEVEKTTAWLDEHVPRTSGFLA
jgi:hypothetical protein